MEILQVYSYSNDGLRTTYIVDNKDQCKNLNIGIVREVTGMSYNLSLTL